MSTDVHTTIGAAAIWIVARPKSPRAREHIALLEWHDKRWRHVGGSSGPADDPVDVEVLEVQQGGGVFSLTRSTDPPRSLTTAPWISCVKVRLGRDVGHVLIDGRRLENPEQCRLIAVWTSPYPTRAARPVIVAMGRDGAELSRLGPDDSLDTHTWARLREEL
ncbi:hypothetical protein [Streptomyces longisporus]|uniref:hypothetical protein n=1 Tax=Streptomyces longisporus TaxID=1948 RepID=UPI0031E33493